MRTSLEIFKNRPRNLIINSNLDHWQRGTSFITAGGYTADRFLVAENGTGSIDVSKQVSTTDLLSPNSLRIDIATAIASPLITDYAHMEYKVEGYDARSLIGHEDAIFKVRVKSNITGTHYVAFQNAGRDRSLVMPFEILVADTLEEKIFKIPKIDETLGTWDFTNGIGFEISYTPYSGDTAKQTANLGSWQSGNFRFGPNQQNMASSIANYIEFSQFQLHVGTEEVTYNDVVKGVGEDFSDCQRYYERHDAHVISANTGANIYYMWIYKTTKRIVPVISVASYPFGGSVYSISTDFVQFIDTAPGHLSWNGLQIDAEL